MRTEGIKFSLAQLKTAATPSRTVSSGRVMIINKTRPQHEERQEKDQRITKRLFPFFHHSTVSYYSNVSLQTASLKQ